MGRTITEPQQQFNADVDVSENRPVGFLGVFGNGLYKPYYGDATFTVPDGIEQIRVRVVGPGGGGGNDGAGDNAGGGGGGYAHGVFNVSPGDNFPVTVPGMSNVGQDGGTTSFGSLISATGGTAGGPNTGGVGGSGTGGDFQASGGSAFDGGGSGGGGAGSQLGDGGSTLDASGGGAGVLNDASGNNGSSAFGVSGISRPYTDPDSDNISNISAAPNAIGFVGDKGGGTETDARVTIALTNPTSAAMRFPFDGFTGPGGFVAGSAAVAPGPGGGAGNGDTGHDGGGGGGESGINAGNGGIGGGGGARADGSGSGQGGQGLVVVEW